MSFQRQKNYLADFHLNNLRHLRHQRDKIITHADFADFADSNNSCSSVSLRLTKTYINPLKRMEAEPWCLSSALFFQERALNTKNESLTAPSSKGLHPLQGDKHGK